MAAIDLAAVMDAIANTAVAGEVVERAYPWPTLEVSPVCLIVGYPTELNFDTTMARGSDRATFPVWIVCGKAEARTTRDVVTAYITGATGVKDVLDGNLGGAVQSARVMSMVMENANIAGIDYLAARFDLDVLT